MSHPLYDALCNIVFFGLTQVVKTPTHIFHCCSYSLIDLVLISNPSVLSSCQTIPPLSTSDHLSLEVDMKMKCSVQPVQCPSCTIWRYSNADWRKAQEVIEAFDWNSITSDDMNLYWSRWCEIFLGIMEKCFPKTSLPTRRNLLWLNHTIKNAMRKRDTVFKKSGYSTKFRSARNKVTSMLAKSLYFKSLKAVLENSSVCQQKAIYYSTARAGWKYC